MDMSWGEIAEAGLDDTDLAERIVGRLGDPPLPSVVEWEDLLYASMSRLALVKSRAVVLAGFLRMNAGGVDDHRVAGEALLSFAASFARPDAVELLLGGGASPHGVAGGVPPLERLLGEMNGDGRLRTAEILLAAGASPVGRDGSPLWESVHDDATGALLKGAWESVDFGSAALPGIDRGGRRGP